MENAELKTWRYAGFGVRLTAWGIESTLIQLFAILIAYLLGQAAMAQDAQQNLDPLVRMGWLPAPGQGQTVSDILLLSGASGTGTLFSGTDIAIYLVCSAFYHTWFTASTWQATPGKRLVGLSVYNADGGALNTRQSFARELAVLMPTYPIYLSFFEPEMARFMVLILSVWWYGVVLVHPQRTAMHDRLCATRVLVKRV